METTGNGVIFFFEVCSVLTHHGTFLRFGSVQRSQRVVDEIAPFFRNVLFMIIVSVISDVREQMREGHSRKSEGLTALCGSSLVPVFPAVLVFVLSCVQDARQPRRS